MAAFRGTVQGMRGEASRLGGKADGLTTRAAGWEGAVRVHTYLHPIDGREYAEIVLEPGNAYGSVGPSVLLYAGPMDEKGREIASGHVANPPKAE